MIAKSQQKSVDVVKKTLREVIVDVIALRSRSGGASFGEIVTVIRNYWQRDDGKEMTDASISNHLIKMSWQPPRLRIPRKSNPLHQIGGEL